MKPASKSRLLGCLFLAFSFSPPTMAVASSDQQTDMQRLVAVYQSAWKDASSLPAWRNAFALHEASDESFRKKTGQALAMLNAEMGLYDEAIAIFPLGGGFGNDTTVAPEPPADTYAPADAADAIARLAKERRVVMVNEAHHVPQTRALMLDLLPRLRRAGFTHSALETLATGDAADTGLQARGYAVRNSGVYTREPVFGEVIRTALRLGFILVPYEAENKGTVQERETGEARNLAAILRDPSVRVLVHAGFGHIREQDTGERMPMAAELKRLTGIDPLTIDQTVLRADIPHSREHPIYRRLLARMPSAKKAEVFGDGEAKPWSLEPDAYDITAVLPDLPSAHGRLGWLWTLAERQPVTGYADTCAHVLPCLVEARRADEGADAVPLDAMLLVSSHSASPALALLPGRYTLAASDGQGHQLGTRTLDVQAATGANIRK